MTKVEKIKAAITEIVLGRALLPALWAYACASLCVRQIDAALDIEWKSLLFASAALGWLWACKQASELFVRAIDAAIAEHEGR